MNRKAQKRVEKIIQVVAFASFDARKLLRLVKKVDDCKSLLEDSSDETLAAEGFAKKILKTGRPLSRLGAFLYRKVVSAVLRRQTTMALSQDVFFSSQGDSKHIGNPAAALYRQD